MNLKMRYLLIILTSVVLFSSCKEDEYLDWKYMNEQWLENLKAEKANEADFYQTESGLCYKIIHQGELRTPNSGSAVNITYTGTYIDGKVFDSGTYRNYLSGAIAGWQEAVKKMKGGARFILYIPADLAYGVEGSGAVPPYSTLIFDITLVSSVN